jgi:NmrA-like family
MIHSIVLLKGMQKVPLPSSCEVKIRIPVGTRLHGQSLPSVLTLKILPAYEPCHFYIASFLLNHFQGFLGPRPERENGAVIFDTPTKEGLIPMISLDDIGWWTRYTFDHLSETSGQELKIATEMMSMEQVAEIFTRVTGIPAVRKHVSMEEYWATRPSFPPRPRTYLKTVYSAVYNTWRDNILTRDMEWIRKTHPTGFTLETWIKTKGYDGSLVPNMTWLPSEAERKLISQSRTPKAKL